MDDCLLEFGPNELVLGDFGSIWYRRPVAPDLPPDLDSERAEWIAGESLEALRGVWRSFEGLWVNHPDANDRASSKLEQLRRARSLGFNVPETVVTNDPRSLLEFAERVGTPLVCKPIRSGYLSLGERDRLFFTSPVNKTDIASFADDTLEPYLFQGLIEKQYELRVTVIGEQAFAVRLDSQRSEDTSID